MFYIINVYRYTYISIWRGEAVKQYKEWKFLHFVGSSYTHIMVLKSKKICNYSDYHGVFMQETEKNIWS